MAAPAALAIQPGQLTWDKFQDAALAQIGLREAGNADKAVFLHQCQRTGLDPFARQIYMIGRNEKQPDGSWGKKWTIQTGIEGWRVIRDRAEKREKVRGSLGRAVWYDDDNNEYKVWVRAEAPAACEITYTVKDIAGNETPYTSVLQFREYLQTTKEGKPASQWATKPVHMLEKCTEADVYRKAFPQDFSGVYLDDAMPAPDLDAPADQPQRQRVTAEQARQRAPQTVAGHAEPVTPDASPAGTDAPPAVPPADPPAAAPAGEAPKPRLASTGQVGMIRKKFEELYPGEESPADREQRLEQTAFLARLPNFGHGARVGSTNELTSEQAARVRKALDMVSTAAELEALIASGEVPGE